MTKFWTWYKKELIGMVVFWVFITLAGGRLIPSNFHLNVQEMQKVITKNLIMMKVDTNIDGDVVLY